MHSKTPLVSICIPTYNRTTYLIVALKSCFEQTYKNFEIIITDNSETEDTKNAVLAIKDKRIRYYKNSRNIGSFNNLIKATKLAKGEYIKFLLDDDLLAKNCLEEMVTAMQKNPTIGVVCAPLEIIDMDGRVIQPRFYLVKKMQHLYRYRTRSMFLDRKIIINDFLTKIYPCCVPTGILYRRSCLDKLGTFDEKFRYICDVELCMRIATEYDFYYIDKYLSSWRYTPSSETVAILHKKGVSNNIFYELTEKYLNDKKIFKTLTIDEKEKIRKESYLFASKRTTLNIVAGLKSGNLELILDTIHTINTIDPYLSNRLKLPLIILREIIVAFIYNSMLLLRVKSHSR